MNPAVIRAAAMNQLSVLCRTKKISQDIFQILSNALESIVNEPGFIYVAPGTAGTIPNGFYSYSIANIGNDDALVGGQTLPAGLSLTWTAAGERDTLNGLAYDSQLTTLLITTQLVP